MCLKREILHDFNFSDPNALFFGVHSTGKIPTTKVGLDFYGYGLKNRRAAYNCTAGREMRHTGGWSRVWPHREKELRLRFRRRISVRVAAAMGEDWKKRSGYAKIMA